MVASVVGDSGLGRPEPDAGRPARLVPLITTSLPPAVGPESGLRPVTTGAGVASAYAYCPAAVTALVPPAVVTVTSTVPLPAGAMTVMWLLVLSVTVASVVPNRTLVAPLRLVPLITTSLPPAVGPESGLRPVTTGAGVASA